LHVFLNVFRRSTLLLAVAAGLVAGLALRRVAPETSTRNDDLTQAVAHLNSELRQLRQERQMPARVVNRSSASICYLYAEYTFEHGHGAKPMQVPISGTGFVAAEGWVATNRHVAEPWWGDPHMEALHRQGHAMQLSRLLAFFPGRAAPVELSHVMVSQDADLAIARFDAAAAGATDPALRPLPLAQQVPAPGDSVIVLGYPMGVEGMLAKSPRGVVRNLAMQSDDVHTARQLAALALLRPSATQGHLGDVVADKLLYDASTAQGASGSPVFNGHGEVIGVNTAFLTGFSGGGIGVSVTKLRPLLTRARALAVATGFGE
jgi:S1-C subfamily serine protease